MIMQCQAVWFRLPRRLPALLSCVGNLCGGAKGQIVWNANISSWSLHHKWVLDTARKYKVQVSCLQETQITAISAPSAVHAARAAGYQMWFVPAPSHRRGGVAILVQDNLPSSCVMQETTTGGQFLVVEVSGLAATVIQLATVYSHTGEISITSSLEVWFSTLGRRPAILTGDFNELARQDQLQSLLPPRGFELQATGVHKTSVVPIDHIWTFALNDIIGSKLDQVQAVDHDILEVALPACASPTSTAFKIVPCARRLIPDSAQDTDIPFDLAAWTHLLHTKDIEAAWSMWSHHAENCLESAGWIVATGGRLRGTEPRVACAAGRRGQGQSSGERSLRRVCRRCQEAGVQARLRGPMAVDPQLYKQLCKDIRRFGGDMSLVHARRYRCLEKWFAQLLRQEMETELRQVLRAWNLRMQNLSNAIQWVKRPIPPAVVVKYRDSLVAGPPAVVQELSNWWSELWRDTACRDVGQLLTNIRAIWLRSGRQRAEIHLAELKLEDLQAVLRKMRAKATGPDGWETELLLQLPVLHLQRLLDFLTLVETVGHWPVSMTYWKVCFLPKKDGLISPDQYRPISVGSVLYRAWASMRASQCASHLSPFFLPTQGGGRQTMDCATLVLHMCQLQDNGFCYGASLDLYKAFDSIRSMLFWLWKC